MDEESIKDAHALIDSIPEGAWMLFRSDYRKAVKNGTLHEFLENVHGYFEDALTRNCIHARVRDL